MFYSSPKVALPWSLVHSDMYYNLLEDLNLNSILELQTVYVKNYNKMNVLVRLDNRKEEIFGIY